MNLEVAVVIVAYRSEAVIVALLDSIAEAMGSVTWATVIVDNSSSEAMAEIVEERTDCALLQSANNGYAAGINAGVQYLPRTEAVMVLNPDVRLNPHCVSTMLATMHATGAGIVAPRILDQDGSLFHSIRRTPSLGRSSGLSFTGHPRLSEHVGQDQAYERPQNVDWALGAVLLVSRKLHDQLGGWDESFFLYSEETDFSLRASDAGWATRYEPAASAMHIGGVSGQNARTHTMQIVNRVRLFARRNGRIKAVAYFALSLASETKGALRGRRESLSALRGLLLPRHRPAELGCSDSLIPR